MFGFGKAYPYLPGQEIDDARGDRKQAKKIGDTRFGAEALYFYQDATQYYMPYRCITKADAQMHTEHHSCCAGDQTMEVPSVQIRCGKELVRLTYSSTEASREAARIIREKTDKHCELH